MSEAELDEAILELQEEGRELAELAVGIPTAELSLNGSEHLTDLGNCRRLVNLFGSDLKFCHQWGRWIIYKGGRWEIDKTGGVERFAKEAVRGIYGEAEAQEDPAVRKAIADHAKRSESDQRIRAMIKLAESEPEIIVTPDQLDVDPFLFNVINGTIDQRTGKLREHRRSDLITKITPVIFDPMATCPRWEEFLAEIFDGREDTIDFVWLAIGYSSTGDTREQCFFIPYGGGANGKSTFQETVGCVMGDYGQSASFSTFLKKDRDGISNDIAGLSGARFVSASEAESGRRLSEVLIKQLTGCDRVRARFLYAEEFDFRPTAKIWLATNHKPIIRGGDLAIWRRIRLIPFTVTVPEEKQDKTLSEKLKAEAPGILAWIIRGCLEWQARGLHAPEEVRAATAEYRNEMDVLGDFLSECCVTMPEAKVSAGDLYKKYSEWSERSGESKKAVMSKRALGAALAERGFQAERTSGARLWKGIGLLQ